MPEAEFQPERGHGAKGLCQPVAGFRFGTVYGAALNLTSDTDFIESTRHSSVYKVPPLSPVLYIKPPGSLCGSDSCVPVPRNGGVLEAAVTIGVVIGRNASAVGEEEALSYIDGYLLAIDLTVPHDDLYRPPVVQRARNQSLAIGPWIVPPVAEPDRLTASLSKNGKIVQDFAVAALLQPPGRLLASVTEFLSLSAGDVLLLGVPVHGVEVRPGDRLEACAEGFGQFSIGVADGPEC